jgi:6-pyruvoyltetrahydropterin/6-carboxytetrahydropterin synthase
MPVSIEKTFRFDAGHRALGFKDRKEETLHGHTWHLRVVIESREELGPQKTLFDTNALSRIVKPIIEQVDHSFVIWSEDPLYERLAEICRLGNIADKLYRVDFNPTAEGIVEYLFNTVNERLCGQAVTLKRADLDATPTIRASYWK